MANPYDVTYSPNAGLSALYEGYDPYNKEQQDALNLEKIRLANEYQGLQNQRYGATTPLELDIKGLEAAQAREQNTPLALQAFLGGKQGTQQQQQAQGEVAMAEAPQKIAKAGLMSRFAKAQSDATNPELPEDQRLFARKQATEIGTLLAETDPGNVAKLEQLQLKQKLQGMKPSDVTALMNWASRTGTSLGTAIDLFKQGTGYMGGNEAQQQTIAAPQGQFAFSYDNLGVEDKASVDGILTSVAQGKLSNQDAQAKLMDIAQKYPSKLLQQPISNEQALLGQPFANKSNNATVQERAANLTNGFVQTVNELKNALDSPAASTMGIFAGMAGKDKDTIVTSISSTIGRGLTSEEDRTLQQAVSGFKVTLANVIGGGFASASSKARMEALADQLPRAGDAPSAKLVWLAKVKQELEAAAETFDTRESANEAQKKIVREKMQEINRMIPWDMSDVNSALRKQTKQGTTLEAGVQAYKKPIVQSYEDSEKERRYQEWKAKQGK